MKTQNKIVILWFFGLTCIHALELDTCTCMTSTDARKKTFSNEDVEDKMRALEVQMQQLQKLVHKTEVSHFTTIDGFPRDCLEIYRNGTRADGLYSISPDGRCPFLVYCDMTNGGWTLIQKRVDDNINFYRSWDDYVSGFGDIEGSHWLGLEKIHRLTKEGSQIYFEFEYYDGSKSHAHYQVFTVHDAATAYKMNVDAFNYEGTIPELLSFHDNMKFSTYDRDNDAGSRNCCLEYDGGGWWYNSCYRLGALNGIYGKRTSGGIAYSDHKINHYLENVIIKVKDIKGVC